MEPEPKGFQVQKPGAEAYLETHGYTTTTLQFFLSFFHMFFEFFAKLVSTGYRTTCFLLTLKAYIRAVIKKN